MWTPGSKTTFSSSVPTDCLYYYDSWPKVWGKLTQTEKGRKTNGLQYDLLSWNIYYQFSLLQVRFLTPIYHLNVCPSTGHVCLGFLSEENWLPTRCVRDVLSAVFALLIRPELEIAADQTLLNMFNHNRSVYEEKARKSAQDAKWTMKEVGLQWKTFALIIERFLFVRKNRLLRWDSNGTVLPPGFFFWQKWIPSQVLFSFLPEWWEYHCIICLVGSHVL